ncbi:diguanylate cyclase [Gordonia sp. NPDC003424]
MSRHFDQRTLAVLAAESGAVPLLLIAFLAPNFVHTGDRWGIVVIGIYTVISIVVTILASPLDDMQFALLSFGGMLGIAGSAALLTDDGAAHAVLALLAVIPAIAAMESPPRTVVMFVVVAAGLACLVVGTRATSVAPLIVGGGAVLMAIVVPTYLVTTLRRSLERSLAQQAALSETDPLTHILNRRGLAERWADTLRTATGAQRSIGFIEVDVDFFKEINDREGHSIGDEILVEIAQVLIDTSPSGALVARTGGEEFVIVDVVAHESDIEALCENLRGSVASKTRATISLGAVHAPLVPVPARSRVSTQTMLDELLAIADRQLYMAKRMGRNRVAVTTVEIAAAITDDPSSERTR